MIKIQKSKIYADCNAYGLIGIIPKNNLQTGDIYKDCWLVDNCNFDDVCVRVIYLQAIDVFDSTVQLVVPGFQEHVINDIYKYRYIRG